MTAPSNPALTTTDLDRTPQQIAAAGWSVVIPGALYAELAGFLAWLVNNEPDPTHRAHYAAIHAALHSEAIPVQTVPRKK